MEIAAKLEQCRLPYLRKVACICSTYVGDNVGQRIDTGVCLNAGDRVYADIDMRLCTKSGVWYAPFGVRNSATSAACRVMTYNGTWYNEGFSLHPTPYGRNMWSGYAIWSLPQSITLNCIKVFAEGSSVRHDSPSYDIKYYGFRVERGNQVLVDLIPVICHGGKPGMYDLVSRKTFENIGEGDFDYEDFEEG